MNVEIINKSIEDKRQILKSSNANYPKTKRLTDQAFEEFERSVLPESQERPVDITDFNLANLRFNKKINAIFRANRRGQIDEFTEFVFGERERYPVRAQLYPKELALWGKTR